MKHEDTKNQIALEIEVMLFFGEHLDTEKAIIN